MCVEIKARNTWKMKYVVIVLPLLVALSGLHAGEISKKRPEVYSLHIVSDIKYRYATTLVTSRVKNLDEKSREAIFDVTLPNEAFITNLTLDIDGKIIVGEIKEKEVARQQYEAAKHRGESAGYIGTKHRETNKFNLAITVAPLSKVSFNLTYQELLKRKHGYYEQVIYIDPGQPVADMHVTVAILETREISDLVVPPLRNDIDLDLTGTGEMSSVVIQQPAENKAYIKYFPSVEDQLAASESGISGQFVVKYDVDREMDGGDLMVVNGYFVHFFAPEGFDRIPKDVLFVLDKSGSMHGKKIEQLKEAMISILDELNEGDRMNIMGFSTSTSFWRPDIVDITGPEVIEEAKNHVKSIYPGGWTDIESALSTGLAILVGRNKDPAVVRSPVLVFLTDGEPTKGITNKDELLASVRERNIEKIPIFSLAFGEGADYELVKKISAQNYGFARKIYEASDADKQIAGFYKEISVTLLNNVSFTYLDAPVSNVTNTKYPYYFSGSEVIVAGKMVNVELQNGLVLRSEIEANSVEGIRILQTGAQMDDSGFSYMNNMTGTGDFEKITEKVWAYLTIKELLQKALATEDNQLKDGYNRRVLELSLKYGFVTPLTSMVVTKPNAKEEIDEGTDMDQLEEDEDIIAPKLLDGDTSISSRDLTGPLAMPSGVMHSQSAYIPQRHYGGQIHLQRPPPVLPSGLVGSGPLPGDNGFGSKIGLPRRKTYRKKQKHRRRKDKRKQKKQKRKLMKLIDFPVKVNYSYLDQPLCFGMYSEAQFQNKTVESYLLYSDRAGTNVTVETTIEKNTRWRKLAVIKKVTIETLDATETITRGNLQNNTFIKRELAGFDMYIQRSTRFDDGVTLYFEGVSLEPSDLNDGLLVKLMSRKIKLKKVITIESKKRKRKHPKPPQKRGLFKIKTGKGFVGVLVTLPDQPFSEVGSSCWDVQKHETKFFDINKIRIVSK